MSSLLSTISPYINLSNDNFQHACGAIIAAPLIWNILASIEYKTHLLTRVAFNDRKLGCYMLAIYIFTFSLFRDYLFHKALATEPAFQLVPYQQYVDILAYLLMGFGGVLVGTSMWALGVTGTYLGDYFGILMDAPVTGFPFNVTANPMYDGATLIFLGQSLKGAVSPAGLFMTVLVYVMYRIGCQFEEPFTAYIYAEKERKEKESKKSQ